jgi:hypothetical protein
MIGYSETADGSASPLMYRASEAHPRCLGHPGSHRRIIIALSPLMRRTTSMASGDKERPRAEYDGAKRNRGPKLNMAVDTLGHLLALHVTPANVDDRAKVGKLARLTRVMVKAARGALTKAQYAVVEAAAAPNCTAGDSLCLTNRHGLDE